MTETYFVKITSQAQQQIQEIIHYITYDLKAHDAALHLLNTLEDNFNSLSQFPQRIALIDEEPWRTKGIHRLPVKNFLVYFWIDEPNKRVQIIAIIYSKRDQLKQLSQMDME